MQEVLRLMGKGIKGMVENRDCVTENGDSTSGDDQEVISKPLVSLLGTLGTGRQRFCFYSH